MRREDGGWVHGIYRGETAERGRRKVRGKGKKTLVVDLRRKGSKGRTWGRPQESLEASMGAVRSNQRGLRHDHAEDFDRDM